MKLSPSPAHRARRFAHTLVALCALATTACNVDPLGLTSPTAPAPPAADLTGTWEGIVSVTYDIGEGSCEERATATFAQTGASVSATLIDSPDCGRVNQYRFEGRLEGNVLLGNMVFPEFVWSTWGELRNDELYVAATNVRWTLRR